MSEKVFSRTQLLRWSEANHATPFFEVIGYDLTTLHWPILADGLTWDEMVELELLSSDEWMVKRSEWIPSLDHGFTGQEILEGRVRLKRMYDLDGSIIGGLW
jgi:hypothetical protein